MFCTKCGVQIDNSAKFCKKCGNEIKNIVNINNDGCITFARKKQFYGILVPVNIYVDGVLVASISAGQEISVPISVGKHRIAFNLWSGNAQEEIELSKEHTNKKINFKLCFGLITSKPKIISIENM